MLKLRLKGIHYLLVGLLTIFSSGCLRDLTDTVDELDKIKSVKWNPELAIPLIKTELTPADILKQYNIDVVRGDDEGLLHFIYEDKYISVRAEEIFKIEDQTHNTSFMLGTAGAAALINTGSFSTNIPIVLDFTIADIEVDSMILKVCDHIFQMTSNLQHDISGKVNFPDVTQNGTPYTVTFNSPYTSGNHNININNDLTGYTFNCTNGSQGYNQIRANLELTITRKGSNPVNATDNVALNNEFNSIAYRIFWGLGKQQSLFQSSDSIEITIFSNRAEGSFQVINPRFVAKFSNSFGAKIQANVNNLTAWHPQSGNQVVTGIPSPLPIPTPTNAQIGQILQDSVVLDNNTSNIETVINTLPHGVFFDFNAMLNPPGTTERNFVLDTSRFETDLFVDIPLDGTARDFVLERVQDFNMDIDSAFDQFDYALFRINVDNGFPVDLELQLYFEDDNGTVIDSMFNGPLDVQSGTLNSSGRISAAVNTIEDVKVEHDKYDRIQSATKMRVRARMNTPFNGGGTQDRVKFFEEYRLDLKIGVQTKLSITN